MLIYVVVRGVASGKGAFTFGAGFDSLEGESPGEALSSCIREETRRPVSQPAAPQDHQEVTFELELEDSGILRLTWPRGSRIQQADAQRAMDRVNEICGEARHPMIVDMATTADVTRGARSVFAKPCQASRIALWGSSPVDRVIANFFIGIMKPPCPTRFFTSETEALLWLREQ